MSRDPTAIPAALGKVDVDDRTLALILAGVFRCVTEPGEAVYVSAPITTGHRFVEWRRGAGADLVKGTERYREEHRRHVVAANLAAARPVVHRARSLLDRVVIDPTALEDVPGWEQHDYHAMWAAVVEQYAGTVVFVDGWEYSTGCVIEFLTAHEKSAVLLDESLTELSPQEGLRRVTAAIADLSDGVLPTDGLEQARSRLESTIGRPAHRMGA